MRLAAFGFWILCGACLANLYMSVLNDKGLMAFMMAVGAILNYRNGVEFYSGK